ncbi:MAG: outer membrane protein transport protein [Muribaculaceae bacterium]|nr:outer membrane protein transport protein [Muribaculaceae bacterium]
MNKIMLSLSLACAGGVVAHAQSAIDGYRFSQPDLKGTARFMGMAGAFGALGGDLSTLSQNPGGIGIYRSNDVGFTVDLDFQKSLGKSDISETSLTQTKFLLNNIGGVFTLRLPSKTVPNLNFGFTYNKGASFNRQYGGSIPLRNSLSKYIAGIANSSGPDNTPLYVEDVTTTDNYDPYYPGYNDVSAPWLTILGYDSYLITPTGEGNDTQWYGQWGSGTSGLGRFNVKESGSVDEYNIAFGGNIANVLYWGMNFDIVNFNYTQNSYWGENLQDAYVPDNNNEAIRTTADWTLHNYYNVSGSGFNYQLGVILKPIQEFRIGLAFHTPTWYNMTETYGADINYKYAGTETGGAQTNNGQLAYNDMCFRTPMKFIASAAGVIGNSFIVSLDYEWTPYNKMKFSQAGSYGSGSSWDYGYDYPWYYGASPERPAYPGSRAIYWDEEFYETNNDIKNYYQTTNTIRLGAEYRITQNFSVRAGYSYVSSPIKSDVRENKVDVMTSGTMPNYRVDNETNYITLGAGYRGNHFYADIAYVYKNMQSEYHAFTPDPVSNALPSPQSKLSLTNNQVVLTAGYRF